MKSLLVIYCIKRCIWVKFYLLNFIIVFLANIFQWNLLIFTCFQSNRTQRLDTLFLWDFLQLIFSLYYIDLPVYLFLLGFLFFPNIFFFKFGFWGVKKYKKQCTNFLFFKIYILNWQNERKLNYKKNDTRINHLPSKLTEFYNFKVAKTKLAGNGNQSFLVIEIIYLPV